MRTPGQFLRLLYVLLLIGWQLARATPIASFWLFEMVDIFFLWAYVPALVLVVWGLLGRKPAALLAALVALLPLTFDYAPLVLPQSPPPQQQGVPLRVMTVNLVWQNADVASVSDAVAREQPDVLAVQELGTAMAQPLADALRDRFPYQTLAPLDVPQGLGMFSRVAFDAVQPADIGPGPGPCQCQAVTLRPSDSSVLVQIVNAHPVAPDVGLRRLGAFVVPVSFNDQHDAPGRGALLQRIDEREMPLLVVGDLNTSDRQPYYRALRARLDDAFVDAGWGFGWTFPSPPMATLPIPFPLVRIDYVLHSAEWRTRAAWTGYLPSSDHRYVVADLIVVPGPEAP
jgi:vancomycin resistance protein VanJ